MKKILLILVVILTCSCFYLKESPLANNKNKVRTIALANKTVNKISWDTAKNNEMNLSKFIIGFNVSYLSNVTINSAYCSIYFNTDDSMNFVIDIQAVNYPIYTFTNRYEEDTFASIDCSTSQKFEYELPEYITNINQASFQKTQLADKNATNDEILNNLIYFLEPIEYQTNTVSYKVLPEEANNKTISISLSWVEHNITENINEYLSYEHNSELYTISVKCLKKSNHQAKLLITSIDDPSISNYILIDFEQEFLGWNSQVLEINKTLTLDSEEKITSLEDIKNTMLMQSKDFLGTIPIFNKEITNLNIKLSYVKISLINTTSSNFINSNQALKDVYQASRESVYSTDFIDYISNNYIINLTNSQKKKIRDAQKISFNSSYSISFDYYGATHYFVIRLNDTVSTQAFKDVTYVNVGAINTETNILFK